MRGDYVFSRLELEDDRPDHFVILDRERYVPVDCVEVFTGLLEVYVFVQVWEEGVDAVFWERY
jgi:hypothetical protein